MSIPRSVINNRSLSFLEGGGEMGELTINYDWSSSSVGTPDQWPQSLQTTLGISATRFSPINTTIPTGASRTRF